MSGKLDQSLDEIVKGRRGANKRTAVRGRRTAKVTTKTTPTGGVTKATRATKPGKANKQALAAATAATINQAAGPTKGDSKIVATGLPTDVSEQQIKDYFASTIGPVKKVMLTYGPTGQSRGVATIIFSKPSSAAEAANTLNGVRVDDRKMKIEVIVNANQTPAPVPAKSLAERAAPVKKTTKTTTVTTTKAPKPAGQPKKGKTPKSKRPGRNAGRGKPKTAEELDAEMTDYFGDGANGASAQPNVNGGDEGMEDGIL